MPDRGPSSIHRVPGPVLGSGDQERSERVFPELRVHCGRWTRKQMSLTQGTKCRGRGEPGAPSGGTAHLGAQEMTFRVSLS